MLKDYNRSKEYINKLDQLAKTQRGASLWMLSLAANHLLEVILGLPAALGRQDSCLQPSMKVDPFCDINENLLVINYVFGSA